MELRLVKYDIFDLLIHIILLNILTNNHCPVNHIT